MKNLPIYLLFFMSSLCFGQGKKLPVSVSPGYTDLHSMFLAEGKRNGWSTTVTSTSTVSATVIAGSAAIAPTATNPGQLGYVKYKVAVNMAFTSVPLGMAVEVQGGNITGSKQMGGTFFLDNNAVSGYPGYGYEASNWSVEPGGSYPIPGGGVIRSGAQLLAASISHVTEPWSSTVAPTINAVTTIELGYGAALSFIQTTDDLNYTASRVIRFYADSKIGNTGPTVLQNMFKFLIRNFYAGLNTLNIAYDLRIGDNSVSGSTSQQHEFAQKAGRDNLPVKAVLWIQDATTNDVGTGVNADSTAARNVRLAKFRAAINPGSIGLVLGGTPRNDGFQTQQLATNTKVQTAIVALNNPNIRYVAPPTWTFSDASYYSDGTLHPNDKGNLAWFYATLPSLPTVLPTPTPR